jgi:3-oxoacyl-[acyl-carrier protein] reductase
MLRSVRRCRPLAPGRRWNTYSTKTDAFDLHYHAGNTFQHRIAVITGGTRGIGRSIAERLYRSDKYHIALLGRDQSQAEAVAAEISLSSSQRRQNGDPPKIFGIKCDVRDSSNVGYAFETIESKLGGPASILVNNAGISIDSLLVRTKDEDIASTMETNVMGALYTSRQMIQSLLRHRWSHGGAIVNIGSVIGHTEGGIGQVAYATSKAAMIGMTKSLALELASRRITVNLVAPGYIKTDMTAKVLERSEATLVKDRIPLGRIGDAQEIAETVSFLIENEYITGQVITVDGGMSL